LRHHIHSNQDAYTDIDPIDEPDQEQRPELPVTVTVTTTVKTIITIDTLLQLQLGRSVDAFAFNMRRNINDLSFFINEFVAVIYI
jgi:hypothetical protein